MTSAVLVEELSEDQWQRYRDIRIAALESDGHAFGSSLEAELLTAKRSGVLKRVSMLELLHLLLAKISAS